jgi:stress-induced morphogen
VRVRIVDGDFRGMNRVERSKMVWAYLDSLPDEIQSDLSALILLTPEELGESFANFEFEHPTPMGI